MIITIKAPTPEHLGKEVVGFNKEGKRLSGVLDFDQRDGFFIEAGDHLVFDISAVIELSQLEAAAGRFNDLGFPCLTFQSLT